MSHASEPTVPGASTHTYKNDGDLLPPVLQTYLRNISAQPAQSDIPYILQTKDAGRGLFNGNTSKAEGDVLLTDTPLVPLQFQRNTPYTLCCIECHQFLADLHQQAIQLAGAHHPQPDSKAYGLNFSKTLPGISEEDQRLSPPIVACQNGCGLRYCSIKCRSRAWQRHHQLMCPGMDRKTELYKAVDAFNAHALQHHEFFVLAAKIACHIILNEQNDSLQKADAALPYSLYEGKAWTEVVDLTEDDEEDSGSDDETEMDVPSSTATATSSSAATAVSSAASSSSAASLNPTTSQSPTPYQRKAVQHLNAILTESLTLLKAILTNRNIASPQWLTHEWYSQCVGMLRLNSLSVDITNPLLNYIVMLDTFKDEKPKWIRSALKLVKHLQQHRDAQKQLTGQKRQRGGESDSDSSSDSDAEDEHDEHNSEVFETIHFDWQGFKFDSTLFVGCHGSALFPVLSFVNHSCDPNAEVQYDINNTAQLVAIKPIQPNEQLYISYIDVDDELSERQQELQGYGFVCKCPKCQQESK